MVNERRLIMEEEPKSAVAEAYRTFRTNLQFAQADTPVKTVLFTSAGPGEGKSSTIGNTAVALAQTGKHVILVDCDLRKPVQHRMFGVGPARPDECPGRRSASNGGPPGDQV